MPPSVGDNVSEDMYGLKTNDDGACGIHAMVGRPTLTAQGDYELFHVQARDFAVRHLKSVELCCQEDADVLQDIYRHEEAIHDVQRLLADCQVTAIKAAAQLHQLLLIIHQVSPRALSAHSLWNSWFPFWTRLGFRLRSGFSSCHH